MTPNSLPYHLLPLLLIFSLAGCAKIKDDRPVVAQKGGGIAQLDSELGLPDARLGAPISEFENLVTIEELGAWATYRRSTDRLRYERWPVDEIIYNFYKGHLYSIRMELSDPRSVKGILVHLYEQYGPETHTQRKRFEGFETTEAIREWDGERVDLVLKYGSDYAGGTLIFVDSDMWQTLNAGRASANRELQDAMAGSLLNLDFD